MDDMEDGDVPNQWSNRNTGPFLPLHGKWQRFSVQLQLVAVLPIVGGEDKIEANARIGIRHPYNTRGTIVELKCVTFKPY
jgi:hypothetical protein